MAVACMLGRAMIEAQSAAHARVVQGVRGKEHEDWHGHLTPTPQEKFEAHQTCGAVPYISSSYAFGRLPRHTKLDERGVQTDLQRLRI